MGDIMSAPKFVEVPLEDWMLVNRERDAALLARDQALEVAKVAMDEAAAMADLIEANPASAEPWGYALAHRDGGSPHAAAPVYMDREEAEERAEVECSTVSLRRRFDVVPVYRVLAPDILAVVEAVEWGGDLVGMCPSCAGIRGEEGHEDDCALHAALTAAGRRP